MTILKRESIFETNSSSTHSLVVPKKVKEENYSLSDSLEHNYYYGREESRLVEYWDEKLAYLYIIITQVKKYSKKYKITSAMIKNFKERINKFYDELYGKVEWKPSDRDPKPNDIFKYIEKEGQCELVKDSIEIRDRWGDWFCPYVDHIEDFVEDGSFLDKVFNDDEFLKRFIFNEDSYITIGGDEYRGYNIKTIGFEYDYGGMFEEESEFWKKLEEYKKDNDVFLKGN